MVARNQDRAQAVRVFKNPAGDKGSEVAGLEPERRIHAVLGAPGRAGTAHVVQFGPVGVESGGEEALPEALDLRGEHGGTAGFRRNGKGMGLDHGHDAVSLCSRSF